MELFLNMFMDFGLWWFKGDNFTFYAMFVLNDALLIFFLCAIVYAFNNYNGRECVIFGLLLLFQLAFFWLSNTASEITIKDLQGYYVDGEISKETLEEYVGKLKEIEAKEAQKKKKKQEEKTTAKKKEEARNRAIKELEV